MSDHIDFTQKIIKREMPETDLAAMLVTIDGQIAAVRASLQRYENDKIDLEKVQEEMLPKVVEYVCMGNLDGLQPAFDDLLNRLEVVRTMAGMLSTAHGKLWLKRGEIDGALKAYGHNRDRIAEAEQAAAARLAWESEQKQHAYSVMRSKLAYEGRQDVIDWPESVADYDAMVAEQQATEKAAQLASQEAQQAAREAAETSRRQRVKEWVQALAPGE